MKAQNNPTMMIKSKFSNQVHKILDRKIGIKKSERWKTNLPQLTKTDKIAAFDQITKLHTDCSYELSAYKFKKREKKRINALREKTGIKPKIRQSKAQYEASKKQLVPA